MTTASVAFPGFRPAAFAFFKELSEHNDPVWFRPRRAEWIPAFAGTTTRSWR